MPADPPGGRALATLGWLACALVVGRGAWRWSGQALLAPEQAGAVVWVCALTLLLGWSLRRHPRVAWGAVLFLGALAGVRGASGPARPPPGPPLVLLTLDTLRADHLGHMPRLRALMGEGARFEQAVALAPLTAPSHASMLTGLAPAAHGVVGNGRPLAGGSVVEALQAAGWRTGAFLSSRVLGREQGFCRGFDLCDDRFTPAARAVGLLRVGAQGGLLGALYPGPPTRRGDQTLTRALSWLGQSAARSFLWVHLYDAHAPYAPPSGWRPGREALERATQEDRAARLGLSKGGGFGRFVDHGNPRVHRLLYAAEVAWVDALLGQLLDGLPPGAVVLVAGDHGESLGEHGEPFVHGGTLTDEVLRVPLVLRWPGRVPPRVAVGAQVGLQRVGPTLLVAAGLPAGGPTLLDALGGVGDAELALATSGQRSRRLLSRPGPAVPVVGLRWAGAKATRAEGAAPEWWDLAADPTESWPRALPAVLPGVEAALAPLVVPALSEQALRELEALGYVE